MCASVARHGGVCVRLLLGMVACVRLLLGMVVCVRLLIGMVVCVCVCCYAWWRVCASVARHGGVCYRRCDGRVVITNVSSSGAVGSQRGFSVDGRRHVYCLWILTVASGLHDLPAQSHVSTTSSSITLTLPENSLHTTCLKVCSPVHCLSQGVFACTLPISRCVHLYTACLLYTSPSPRDS